MMAPQIRVVVEEKIPRRELGGTALERRDVRRILDKVGRGLTRVGDLVRDSLAHGGKLLVEAHAGDDVVPPEEGIEIGPPESRRAGRADAFELAPSNEAKRGT